MQQGTETYAFDFGVSAAAAGPPSPLLTTLQLCCPRPLLQPVTLLTYSWMPAPGCPLLSWTTVLLKVLCCKIKNVFVIFSCLFFMYYLCGKSSKSTTVLYHIANCVRWVPGLTLLDLRTHWTY